MFHTENGGIRMSEEQVRRMHDGKGFIAALDQSGGSTPKALKNYGIGEERYQSEEEMFDMIHQMRTRIIASPCSPCGRAFRRVQP